MFVVLNDPALYEFEGTPPPSVEWLRERFTRLEQRRSPDGQEQWLNWVVRLESGKLIGFVQATVYANQHAAIAYVLASAYWGRGLATEAVKAMLAELRGRFDVRALSALLRAENLRSRRLLEGLGFTLASAEADAEHVLEPGEIRMLCRADSDDKLSG